MFILTTCNEKKDSNYVLNVENDVTIRVFQRMTIPASFCRKLSDGRLAVSKASWLSPHQLGLVRKTPSASITFAYGCLQYIAIHFLTRSTKDLVSYPDLLIPQERTSGNIYISWSTVSNTTQNAKAHVYAYMCVPVESAYSITITNCSR